MYKRQFCIAIIPIIMLAGLWQSFHSERNISRADVIVPAGAEIKTSRREVKQPPQNPMINWVYKPKYGDYYSNLNAAFNKYKIHAYDHHFTKFPIRYTIHPLNTSWRDQIKKALAEYGKYFPIEEILNPADAQLHIYVVDRQTALEKYPTMDPKILGYGRGSLKGGQYIGELTIIDESFERTSIHDTILHELGHAFGVMGHSDNKEDLMYIYNLNKNKGLTPRDLNTLYLLYQQWDN